MRRLSLSLFLGLLALSSSAAGATDLYGITGSKGAVRLLGQRGASKLHSWRQGALALAARYPDLMLLHGASGAREIALTFDDGPDGAVTESIGRLLGRLQVPATFFLNCSNVPAHAAVPGRLLALGHQLANHTVAHPHLPKLPRAAALREIADCAQQLERLSGRPPLFRPPFGDVGLRELSLLRQRGEAAVLWDVDSLDWAGATVSEITGNVMAGLHPGAIVLMHSGPASRNTLAALERLVGEVRRAGYRLVSLDELLARRPGAR